MKKIGLICVMKRQVPKTIRRSRRQKVVFQRVKNYYVGTIVSGVGQAKAAYAFNNLLKGFRPDLLLCLGFCGSANNARVGQLLIADSVLYGLEKTDIQSQYLKLVKEKLKEQAVDFESGLFQTFDQIVFCKENVADPTIAVDMESFTLARLAQRHNIPIMIVRAVSDIIPQTKPPYYKFPGILLKLIANSIKAKKSLNLFSALYFNHIHTA